MSDWCQEHVEYSANEQPVPGCDRCWQLWYYKNPELKHDRNRMVNDYFEENP